MAQIHCEFDSNQLQNAISIEQKDNELKLLLSALYEVSMRLKASDQRAERKKIQISKRFPQQLMKN